MSGTTGSRLAPVDHDTWMALATTEYARLDALLRDLGPDDWAAPTDCVGWDVRATVAHLVGAAEGNARVREGVRQAAVGRRRYRREVLVDSINELQIAERAGRTPDQLVHDLRDAGRRGVAARRRLPDAVRRVVVPIGPPVGTKPIGYLMDCIYTRDAWMHRIDIARATGRDLEVTADHDGVLVADLVAEWATLHDQPFELVLTGPAGLRRVRGAGGERIEIDAIEFARAAAGRLPAEGLLATAVPF
ncbi:MAG: maleylpyruvate isomerase family mycothiol-dependent enzyme [Candidatus Nanopelagicales bacterium]